MARRKTGNKHQMLNLPSKLILALKSRSMYSGESMSSYVSKVLIKELGLEDKVERINEFHSWTKHHCNQGHYRFDSAFHRDYLQILLVNEIIKNPKQWTKTEHKEFFNIMNDIRRKGRKLTVEDVLGCKVINPREFISYYRLNWRLNE